MASLLHGFLKALLRVQSVASFPMHLLPGLHGKSQIKEEKPQYIFGQGSLKGQRLYCAKANLTACEVVSVYNAMIRLGKGVSYGRVKREFLRQGALTLFFLGFFGGNPYSVGRVLKGMGLSYEKVTPEKTDREGTYVISFWNGRRDPSLHTVMCVRDGGKFSAYNLHSNDRCPRAFNVKEYGELFIRGYYLGR